MTDWKDNRYYRLLAWDHGALSWTQTQHNTWPLTLVTWPPPAHTRAGDREPLYTLGDSTHVRLLTWSDVRILGVSVIIDSGDSVQCDNGGGPLWTCPWSPELFTSGSHVMMVEVKDEFGETHETKHEFSLEDSNQFKYSHSLGSFIVLFNMVSFFQVRMYISNQSLHNKSLFQFIFSSLILISVGSLTLARMYPDSPLPLLGFLLHPLSSLDTFYYPLVTAPLYLTVGPWFVGHVLSDSVGM